MGAPEPGRACSIRIGFIRHCLLRSFRANEAQVFAQNISCFAANVPRALQLVRFHCWYDEICCVEETPVI